MRYDSNNASNGSSNHGWAEIRVSAGAEGPGWKNKVLSAAAPPDGYPFNPDGIPEELKELPQWVLWQWRQRADGDGVPKGTKVLINPHTGKNAKVDDPRTHGTYDEALEALERFTDQGEPGLGGLGFVFTDNDPYAGVDLDDCRNPETGELQAWAQATVHRFASYTEISPTGTGVKVIIKGANRQRIVSF
jgi:putative DNA primase/helicase